MSETVTLRDYIDARFSALQEAVVTARVAMDKRLDTMNEFRGSINDVLMRAATRDQLDAVIEKVNDVKVQVAVGSGLGQFDYEHHRCRDFSVGEMIYDWTLTRQRPEGDAILAGLVLGLSSQNMAVGMLMGQHRHRSLERHPADPFSQRSARDAKHGCPFPQRLRLASEGNHANVRVIARPIGGRGHCSINGPSRVQSVHDSSRGHARASSPLCDSECFTVPCQATITAPIRQLLLCRCPSAVFLRVGSVVIDAVNRVLRRWAHPHVGKECREATAPSIAHSNTASSVVPPTLIVRIGAALFRGVPDLIFGRLPFPVRGDALDSETSATRRVHRAKGLNAHTRGCSAIASTEPHDVFAGMAAGRYSDKASKSQSGQIEALHTFHYTQTCSVNVTT